MEPIFINSTKYSEEELGRFLKFHRNKFVKKNIVITAVFVIFMVSLILFNLLNRNWTLVLVLLAMGLVAYLYYTYINVQDKQKNNEMQKEQEFDFLFYDKYLIVKNVQQKSKYNYWKFYRIFETKNNFYLYIDKEYSLILNKKKFVKGNNEEFKKFIKKKCFFRYRNNIRK